MKRLLTNLKCIMALVLIAAFTSIALSVRSHDWTWFGRGGGVITLLGGVLATRRIIRFGVEELFEDETVTDGGHVILTPEEIESVRQLRLDIRAAKLAFWVVSAGTLIWTFGDLLGRAFH